MLRGLGFAFPSAIPVFPVVSLLSKFENRLRQLFRSQKFLLVFPSKSPLFTSLSKLILILF
jgi:hypothetical protein